MRTFKIVQLCLFGFFLLVANQSKAQTTYYWIGGTGNWNDPAHWSLTSNGASAAAVPGNTDNAIFDVSSGAAGFTVTNASMDTINDLTITGTAAFNLNVSLTATGNVSGPASTCTVGSAGKVFILNHTSAVANASFTPNNMSFTCKLTLNSTSVAFGINVLSNVTSSDTLELKNGTINFNNVSVTAGKLYSAKPTTDNRNFTFGTSSFSISKNYWWIFGYTVTKTRPNTVTFTGNMNGTFRDSTNVTNFYNSLSGTTAFTKLSVPKTVKILSVSANIDTLAIGQAERLYFSTITNPSGSCSNLTYVTSAGAAQAQIQYIGVGTSTSFQYLFFNKITAQNAGTINYTGSNIYQTACVGILAGAIPHKFYWIGNGGNVSSQAHWSETSGGIASCFFPQNFDTLIFDASSFTLPNQTVVFDTAVKVGKMDWFNLDAADGQVTFRLDTTLEAHGDVSFDPRVYIFSNLNPVSSTYSILEFKKKAKLDLDSSLFDINLSINMTAITDTLAFTSNYIATDSSAIYLQRGIWKTNNHKVHAQGFFSYESTTKKKAYFGNSVIELVDGWDSDTLDFFLDVFPGTSKVTVGRSKSTNFFYAKNQTFYDVVFNFNPRKKGLVKGSNTMHHLTITPGSMVQFEATRTFTLDSLIIDGGCNKLTIDTLYSIIYTDSTVIDTVSITPVTYTDTSTTNLFGVSPIIPAADTLVNMLIVTGHMQNYLGGDSIISVDTTLTNIIINNAPIIDTLSGPTRYVYYLDTVFYEIHHDIYYDSTGFMQLYDFAVNNDTLTGRQQVMLFTSTAGSQFTFNTPNSQEIYGTSLKDIRIIGTGTRTAYFSTNVSNNTNWTFDTSPSTTAMFTLSNTPCGGDTITITNTSTAFSGDVNDLIYVWDFAGDELFGDTSSYSFQSSGMKVVTLTTYYTNSCSSVHEDSIEIFYPTVVLSMDAPDTTICAGTIVEFSASSPDTLALFQFYLNGASLGAYSLVDSVFVSGLTDLDTVSVTASKNGCLSLNEPELVFDVIPLPTVALASSDLNDTICIGTPVTFTASGATTYQYFLNNVPLGAATTSNTIVRSNLVDGDVIYTIGTNTVTGCKDTSNVHLFQVDALPTVTLTASVPSPVCNGTSVTFTAGGADSYQFYINGVPQGTVSTTNTFTTSSLTTSSTVTVKGYTNNGCEVFSGTSLFYTVIPIPNVTLTVDDADSSVCAGQQVNFYAFGASSYQFFVNGVSQGAPSATNSFSSSTLVNNSNVQVVGSFSGCPDSSGIVNIEIRVNPTTTLTSNDLNDTICSGQAVLFTATGASTYQFLQNGTPIGLESTVNTFSSSSLTNGTVISVIGRLNNCTVSDQVTIGVLPVPNVNIVSSDADNTICAGSPITFTGSGASQYALVTNGTPGLNQASGVFNPTLSQGTYTIAIQGTGANGCTNLSNSTFNVTVNAIPSVTMLSSDADNTICTGNTVTFNASGAVNYQFFIDGVSQTSNSPTSTFTTNSLTNGQVVHVTGTTTGCVGTSPSIPFVVNANPVVSLTSSDVDNIFCQGAPTVFTATGATNYQFFLNGAAQGAPSATNTFNGSSMTPGIYSVSVTGNQNNCLATSSFNVIVNPNPSGSIASSDADNIICTGNNVTFTGTGGNFYQFFLNGLSQGVASPNPTYSTSTLTSGDAVHVIVSSNAGCTFTTTPITTTVNPVPAVLLSSNDPDNTICAGTPVGFTGSGANTYEFFVNSVSQGAPSASPTFNTSTLTNNQTVYVTGTTNGCSMNSLPITFTVNNYPAISLINPSGTNLCGNQTAQVSASGAGTYQFSLNGTPIGPFGPTFVFNQLVANGDVLTVSGSSFGCTTVSPTTFTFTVTPTPVLNVLASDADFTICYGDQVDFTASGASNYQFLVNNIPVQNGSNPAYSTTDLEDGSILTAQGFNGNCPSNIINIPFTVQTMQLGFNGVPNAIVCDGSSLNLTASGADLYEFFVNGVSQGAASATNTFSLTNTTASDVVTFIGTNTTTGCTQDLGYDIHPTVVPTVTITNTGSTVFCQGDSLILVSGFSYGNQWYVDGNLIPGATNDTLIVFTSGNYTLEQTTGGNGELWSQGYNGSGTFGDATNLDSPTPVASNLTSSLTQVSSGYDFMIGLTAAGTVFSWGTNSSGQLGNGTYTTTNSPAQVPTLNNIVSIATTSSSVMALNASGQVYVWGNNSFGQLGVGSTAVINFPFLLPTVTNVSQIIGGQDHFVLLKNDGTVWTCGKNTFGQLGTGTLTNTNVFVQVPGLAAISRVGSGENHSFAIDGNGDVYVWGNNIQGQLGLGDNTNRLSPTLSNLQHIERIEGGANHTVAISTNKEVYVMGDNTYGQLGTSTLTATNYPVKLTASGFAEVSASEYATMLLTTDARVFAAGYNAEQQIQNAAGDVFDLVELTQFDGVTLIESGRRTSSAIFGVSGSCTSTAVAVTVNTPVVPTLTQNNQTLTSSNAVSYQWYRDGQLLPGETGISYTVFATGNYYVQTTDANGCTANSDTLYFFVASIEDNEQIAISIAPNPTNGSFVIRSSEILENASIDIVDITGRLVKRIDQLPTNEIAVDLGYEQNGTYFVHLVVDQQIIRIEPLILIH